MLSIDKYLKNHYLLLGFKPYTCEYCGKGFHQVLFSYFLKSNQKIIYVRAEQILKVQKPNETVKRSVEGVGILRKTEIFPRLFANFRLSPGVPFKSSHV